MQDTCCDHSFVQPTLQQINNLPARQRLSGQAPSLYITYAGQHMIVIIVVNSILCELFRNVPSQQGGAYFPSLPGGSTGGWLHSAGRYGSDT